MSWQDRVEAAQVKRSKSVNQVDPPLTLWPSNLPQSSLRLPHDFLTPREISLTEEFSAIELLVKLRKREVQAEEVTRAFLRRAAIAHHGVRLDARYKRGPSLTLADKLLDRIDVG